MPNISVIVPVYQVEKYLSRCVRSILAQTYTDFEVILVEDGSPDGCAAICDVWAERDSRVHVIHQENGGLSIARNSGINWVFDHSDSQWLAFVDSDDWVSPQYLERLYRAAVDSGCRAAVCGFLRTSGDPLPAPEDETPRVLPSEDYYCSTTIHEGVTMVAWNKLYHRSLFETLRYPPGRLHEDEFTTYLAIYGAGRVAVMDQPLYAYFQNPEGIMQAPWTPRRMHSLEAVEQQISFARRHEWEGLRNRAVEKYIFICSDQLRQAEMLPEYKEYWPILRRNLRWSLSLGRRTGVFPKTMGHLWAWEMAWPCKPYWWLYGKVRRLWEH